MAVFEGAGDYRNDGVPRSDTPRIRGDRTSRVGLAVAAPAAGAIAKAAASAGRMVAARARARGDNDGGGGGGGWGAMLVVFALAPAGVIVGLVILISTLGGAQQAMCGAGGAGAGGGIPGDFSGPGSLGGVAGTGIPRWQVDRVRSSSPYAGKRITAGGYTATAYGPPWGGIEGTGEGTSGGLAMNGGSPRWYMIAVNPSDISHGTFVYIWPNPFGWKGPFFAADTGGAIQYRRIDFYDWRSRASQNRWGRRSVEVSDKPIMPQDPAGGDVTVTSTSSSTTASADTGGASSSSTGGRVVIGGRKPNGTWRMLSGDLDFRPAVGDALERLAEATNTQIYVREGGRTMAEQQKFWNMYQNGTGNLAAYPSPNAPHIRGVAADISPGRERFSGVAGRFGLAFTVSSESWHIEVTGKAAEVSATNTTGAPSANCDSSSLTVASDLNVKRSYIVRQPRRFQALPRELVTPGYAKTDCDARILPDIVYLLRKYRLKAHECRSDTHATHGDGLSIDIVPAEDETPTVGDTSKMGAWKRLEGGIRTLGWKPSCAGNGCIGQGLVPGIYAIFYNGYQNHGDPRGFSGPCGCPHVHIRWMSVPPSGGVASYAPPVGAVRVFTPPNGQSSGGQQ